MTNARDSDAEIAQPDSSPGYRGSQNSITRGVASILRSRATSERSANPELARRFRWVAERLELCATSAEHHWGWRCNLPACPRCECRKAIRYRIRLEARLRKPGARFAHVTATVAADDLQSGSAILSRCFADLRRSRSWRTSIVGGEAHMQAAPSAGRVRSFNVHLHAVVELAPGSRLDTTDLGERWQTAVARRGAAGHLLVQPVRHHWAIYRE